MGLYVGYSSTTGLICVLCPPMHPLHRWAHYWACPPTMFLLPSSLRVWFCKWSCSFWSIIDQKTRLQIKKWWNTRHCQHTQNKRKRNRSWLYFHGRWNWHTQNHCHWISSNWWPRQSGWTQRTGLRKHKSKPMLDIGWSFLWDFSWRWIVRCSLSVFRGRDRCSSSFKNYNWCSCNYTTFDYKIPEKIQFCNNWKVWINFEILPGLWGVLDSCIFVQFRARRMFSCHHLCAISFRAWRRLVV